MIPQSLSDGKLLDEFDTGLLEHVLGPNATREQDLRTSKRAQREDDLLHCSDVPPRSFLGLADFDADDAGAFEDEARDGRSGQNLEVGTRVDVLGEVARRRRGPRARRIDVSEKASDLREAQRDSKDLRGTAYAHGASRSIEIVRSGDPSVGLRKAR